MKPIQDQFLEAAGDDVTVQEDQARLDADTASDLAAHQGLNQAVAQNGPTLVRLADGTPVALIPNADGTFQNVVLKEGSTPGPPTDQAPDAGTPAPGQPGATQVQPANRPPTA